MSPADLNARQRKYLRVVFEMDQTIEAEMRRIPFNPLLDQHRASEWRWMEYSAPIPEINKPASRLYAAIKNAGRISQGASSTFTALTDRGLIQVAKRGPDHYSHIRMTPAGRKLARSWTSAKADKTLTPEILQEWHWRALAFAYAAGQMGLPDTGGGYAYISWSTWQRLRNYGARPGHRDGLALTRVRRTLRPVHGRDGNAYREASELAYEMVITDAGRALFEQQRTRYCEMYPHVKIQNPASSDLR
jgi:hypothetical protein